MTSDGPDYVLPTLYAVLHAAIDVNKHGTESRLLEREQIETVKFVFDKFLCTRDFKSCVKLIKDHIAQRDKIVGHHLEDTEDEE